MNNNTHDRKIQVKNHKRFQCVYTQVVAQYGFAANYVLDYLFRQGKPVLFSSKRFSQFFRYACEDTYLDVVNKLQADGLIYRVVKCEWDRKVKQPRTEALYGLTGNGRDFITQEKRSRRWLNVAYADLIAFNGRINHAYHYTLLRASTPTEFQLTIKAISALIDASIKTTRNFMAYLIKHDFLIVKEHSSRGVTGVYCHAFAPIPSGPNQDLSPIQQYQITDPRNIKDISFLELNGENTPKNQEEKPKKAWKPIESITKQEILKLFDPTEDELVPLSKLISMTHYQTQKGYVYWSKSLWHNVIYKFAKEFVQQGFSLYHFLDACVRVMYRDKSAAKTVDMSKVFKVLKTEKLLGWTVPHTLEEGIELVRGQEGYKSQDEKEVACMWDAAQILETHNVTTDDIRFCLTSPYFMDTKVKQFLQMMIAREPSAYENWLFQHKYTDAFIYMDEQKSLDKTVLYSDLCVKYGKGVARRLAFSYEFKNLIRFEKGAMADVISVRKGMPRMISNNSLALGDAAADEVWEYKAAGEVDEAAEYGFYDNGVDEVDEVDEVPEGSHWSVRFGREVSQRDRNQPVRLPSASTPTYESYPQVSKPALAKPVSKSSDYESYPAVTEPVLAEPVYASNEEIAAVRAKLSALNLTAFEGETEAQRFSREQHVRQLQNRVHYCAQANGSPVIGHKSSLEKEEQSKLSADAILEQQLQLLGVQKISLQKRNKGF